VHILGGKKRPIAIAYPVSGFLIALHEQEIGLAFGVERIELGTIILNGTGYGHGAEPDAENAHLKDYLLCNRTTSERNQKDGKKGPQHIHLQLLESMGKIQIKPDADMDSYLPQSGRINQTAMFQTPESSSCSQDMKK
jgi:hypothetical protein